MHTHCRGGAMRMVRQMTISGTSPVEVHILGQVRGHLPTQGDSRQACRPRSACPRCLGPATLALEFPCREGTPCWHGAVVLRAGAQSQVSSTETIFKTDNSLTTAAFNSSAFCNWDTNRRQLTLARELGGTHVGQRRRSVHVHDGYTGVNENGR